MKEICRYTDWQLKQKWGHSISTKPNQFDKQVKTLKQLGLGNLTVSNGV